MYSLRLKVPCLQRKCQQPLPLEKGLWTGFKKTSSAATETVTLETSEKKKATTEVSESEMKAKKKAISESDDESLHSFNSSEDEDYEGYSEYENDSDSDSEGVQNEDSLQPDERGIDHSMVPIEDNWEPNLWHDFIDNDNDDAYFGKLYRNGVLYEEKEFGNIELKKWMLFIDKDHFKGTLKDYCVQEGFAITVLWTDSNRYTAKCAAESCDWRIHASRLIDGRTLAIKKIYPDWHNCRVLETDNPICDVDWAGKKMEQDIRNNPDIKGKDLNELIFKRYGLYMKPATLYKMKNDVLKKIFGGHDKSYCNLPAYVKMIHATNPNSTAFCSWTALGDPERTLQFSSIFISLSAQVKGFLTGCRSLIGVDGTHLKGSYGGILLSTIGLDGNNEISPLAYAIVSIENEDNWAYFFWHLYNQLKDDGRSNWTIISDRQKGVDLALKKVWPDAKRRYCCRHLSRNFKKTFPGPLMYILFWRACNATNPFTFKKAMERIRKEGKTPAMQWFAQLGKQSKRSKHKFDPSLCCDSNTSNFVESFNSTLGVDRGRPVLTLLEGIRRVCMVRIATRQQQSQNWNESGICPKIAKLVKEVGKSAKFCTAHKSAPGEYEIHEGQSQFPLSLNNKKCACGAWQLSGIPCRHAIRALVAEKLDPYDFVSQWYSVKTYRNTYSYNINPIPDKEQWLEFEDLPEIQPPSLKRGVGRPPRNRKREEGEDPKTKRAKSVKCANCGYFGHNMRTCKGGLTEKQLAAMEDNVMKNKRKRDQTNHGKEQAKAAKAAKAAKG